MTYIPINWKASLERECKRRRYSEKTAKTYTYCIESFLKFTKKTLDKISKKDVRLFLEHLSEKGKSGNTMNVYHMSIRFLFQDILNKKMKVNIKYSKIPEKLPVVLTKKEVVSLFSSIKNEKHRLMIEFLYSTGLRVSEFTNLTVKNIDMENSYGWVRKGKGGRDRLFIIAKNLKPKIKELIEKENLLPWDYLFSNSMKCKYNIRTPQQILKHASIKSGINKRITPHILRHSFATHLIDNGYSVIDVQNLLGHKSPETTFTYLHIAAPNLIKTRSPFDDLQSKSNEYNTVIHPKFPDSLTNKSPISTQLTKQRPN